jgi:hypothetical protein
MIWWMFVNVAVADAVPCMEASLAEIRPEDGATAVPIDARYLLFFEDNGCGSDGFATWVLTEDGASEPTDEGSVSASFSSLRADIEPAVDLVPSTLYELAVSDGFSEDWTVAFTSGTGAAATIESLPTGQVTGVGFVEEGRSGSGTWTARLDLSFQGFASGLSIVSVYDAAYPADVLAEVSASELGRASRSLSWQGDDADELCLVFVQEDEAGRGTELSDEACTEIITREGGCSALGASGLGLWWLAVVPLWRRARRESGR